MYGTRRAEERYVWYIAQKLSQHQQFVRNVSTEAGSLVLRITIARDGRLVDVGLSRSSGLPSLDECQREHGPPGRPLHAAARRHSGRAAHLHPAAQLQRN
jgi:hypothetical protein